MDFVIGVKDVRFQAVLSQIFEASLLDASCRSSPLPSQHRHPPNQTKQLFEQCINSDSDSNLGKMLFSLLAQISSKSRTVLKKGPQCFVIFTLSQNNESTIRFICINSQQLTLIVTFYSSSFSNAIYTPNYLFDTKTQAPPSKTFNQEGTHKKQISLEIMHHFAGRCECCRTSGNETPLTFRE